MVVVGGWVLLTGRTDECGGNCKTCNEEYITPFPAAFVDCVSVKSFNYAGNSLLPYCLPSNIHL